MFGDHRGERIKTGPDPLRHPTIARSELRGTVDVQADARESVRAHPELKSTFLSLRAAEAFAAQRIADPNDRARCLDLVRHAMAGSIRKGEPPPSVRLRDQRARSEAKPPVATPKREEPTR
jgi:hypothetical protein